MLEKGTGWVPDPESSKDRTPETPTVALALDRVFGDASPTASNPRAPMLPGRVDLRAGFPPIYDQGQTNSCTANALSGLVAYFEGKTYGTVTEPSRLFLYKATRNLIRADSVDAGAYLRSALEALTLFGVPPESYWPFEMSILPLEPPAFLYAFGNRFSAIEHYRYDPTGTAPEQVLHRVRLHLAAGLPAAFGFYLYSSVVAAKSGGRVPYPAPNEACIGGHAVVAVGYDDTIVVTHPGTQAQTTGAVLLRNSWGPSWGDGGYGWLPYQYVLDSLAIDWWSILKMDWFDLNDPLFKLDEASTTNNGKD